MPKQNVCHLQRRDVYNGFFLQDNGRQALAGTAHGGFAAAGACSPITATA